MNIVNLQNHGNAAPSMMLDGHLTKDVIGSIVAEGVTICETEGIYISSWPGLQLTMLSIAVILKCTKIL